MFSKVSKMLTRERDHNKQMQRGAEEAENFQLAPAKGLPYYLKFPIFALLGYFNARLFYHAVPGWLGIATALVALSLEALALYCIINFVKSSGAHKTALGVFGVLLSAFSLVHATLSWFQAERSARWGGAVQFYAEVVAFPLLFLLLGVACAVIYLTHFRQKVAQEQAKAMVQIETNRARLLAEGAALRDEAALEQERLTHLEEQIRLEGEYLTGLEKFVQLKEREQQIVNRISDPALREKVARELGIHDGGKQRPALLSHEKDADGPKGGRWGNSKIL